MGLTESAELFTKLTIGDGLVSQVPAFLISLAAGLLVTRSTQKSNMPSRVHCSSSFRGPRRWPWPAVSGDSGVHQSADDPVADARHRLLCALAVMLTKQKQRVAAKVDADGEAVAAAAAKKPEERIEDYLAIDPMEIEIGVGLIRLADPGSRRRPVAAHHRRATGGGQRHRHRAAESSHSRQHASGRRPIPHQDRQQPGRRRYDLSRQAVGHGLGHDDRRRAGRGDTRSGVPAAGGLDRTGHARPSRDARLHAGRTRRGTGHAPAGSGPQARRRTADTRRHKAPDRRTATSYRRPSSTN